MPALLQAFVRLVALKRLGVLLFVFAATVCVASTASALEPAQTKTRIQGFDFAEHNSYGLLSAATSRKHQGNQLAQSELASNSPLAAEASAARTFASSDPLVADLANAIEKAYPGHVVGVNVPMTDAAGHLVTDADILLRNAVIQVKAGSGAGLTRQLARTQTATSLPVIGYGPRLGGTLVQNIGKAGGLVTRDQQFLIDVVAP